MTQSSRPHGKHYRVILRAGVVYCRECRTLYVRPDRYLDRAKLPCTGMLEGVTFMAACQAAYRVLPPDSIDAYVWLGTKATHDYLFTGCVSLEKYTQDLKGGK